MSAGPEGAVNLPGRPSLASLIVNLGMQDEFTGCRRAPINHASERARPLAEKKQRRAKRKQRRNR